jgi:serine protease Do
MQPGDWVMAIGNPFNLAHTVSVGVISASKRPFQVAEQRSVDVLQTDAAINPGNSGGPLVNLRGEVIGINSAIYTDSARAGNIGIGFAIPINTVRDLLPQLRVGKIVRGRIGVLVAPVPREALSDFGLKERRGALISVVTPNGPAAAAGVEPGDVVLEYNGQRIADRDALIRLVQATKPGTVVPVRLLRNKQEKTVSVKVEELNLEAEGNQTEKSQEEETGAGYGMTLGTLTSDISRRLRLPAGTRGALVTDVDPAGAAARAGMQEGDVILQVNRQAVSSASDASRELQKVRSGGTAFLLVYRGGQEVFVTVKKE